MTPYMCTVSWTAGPDGCPSGTVDKAHSCTVEFDDPSEYSVHRDHLCDCGVTLPSPVVRP